MKVVLDIKNESDLALLLPLLERLKIQFSYPKTGKAKPSATGTEKTVPGKNYDPDKVDALFKQLQKMNAFAQIQDPVSWQKQLRDEWD